MPASYEVRSSFNHTSLMNRSRRDLEDRLSMLMRHRGLTRSALADAIMLLARRLPEETDDKS